MEKRIPRLFNTSGKEVENAGRGKQKVKETSCRKRP